MSEKVYVLHKTGMDSHYQGLEHLLFNNDQVLLYREFSIVSKLFKSITKFKIDLFVKQIINLYFLLSLLFTRNKKIILAIAPFDKKLTRLLPLLKTHKVYYHTSWTSWDGTFMPKNKDASHKLKKKWTCFLEEIVLHIFAVTEISKTELLLNYNIDSSKISVVKHSFDPTFLKYTEKQPKEELSYVYVGRLVASKGIEEVLECFSNHPKAILTIVGTGKLSGLVASYADKNSNIYYTGYVKDKQRLSNIYNQHNFILLNSQRTKKWEELFGMVLIEGMACGLVPVASSHSGPKEVVDDHGIGYLFNEGDLDKQINSITGIDYSKKQKASEVAKFYTKEEISLRWRKILEYA